MSETFIYSYYIHYTMKSIMALVLLGLVMLVPLASAGDVASSEASGVLGVGTDSEDDQGESESEVLRALMHQDTSGIDGSDKNAGWIFTALGVIALFVFVLLGWLSAKRK